MSERRETHDYETTAEVLAAVGVPIAGEVQQVDEETGRLVLATERGMLELRVERETRDIQIGDYICVCLPIGRRTS